MLKVFLLFLFFLHSVSAENMVFITNVSNPIVHLDKAMLKKIYLEKRRFWEETKLKPLNLPPKNPLREKLEKEILKLSASALDTYWMKEHYLGHRPPYRVESAESMILFVKKIKGAIGYIPESKVVPGVKVIYRMKQ